jgi:hypothetical protein
MSGILKYVLKLRHMKSTRRFLITWESILRNFVVVDFLALPVGEIVGSHIDEGTYYLTKDRYHLSIQGKYEYTVGDETTTIEPGTLFWFNNKLPHKAVNIGDNIRITFVFDVPHHKRNL